MKTFKNKLIQITQYGMGNGDEQLGLQLITNYFKLLNEENELPKFITLYNAGVKLVCTGSPVIESIKALESRDVKFIACKTCLNHFDLLDKMEVGIAATMMDIMVLQKASDTVINL